MNEQKFVEDLETGMLIELQNAKDFLMACKICRKHYGRKSILPADAPFKTQCWIMIQENPEKFGRFGISSKLVYDYCREKGLELEDFFALYVGRTEIKRRQRDRKFADLLYKTNQQYRTSYRQSNIKEKEQIIKNLEKLCQ